MNTGGGGRDLAQAAIADAYRVAGLKPPRIWIWLGSPWAGSIGARMLTKLPAVGDQVWGQVEDQVWAQVRDQVWD